MKPEYENFWQKGFQLAFYLARSFIQKACQFAFSNPFLVFATFKIIWKIKPSAAVPKSELSIWALPTQALLMDNPEFENINKMKGIIVFWDGTPWEAKPVIFLCPITFTLPIDKKNDTKQEPFKQLKLRTIYYIHRKFNDTWWSQDSIYSLSYFFRILYIWAFWTNLLGKKKLHF